MTKQIPARLTDPKLRGQVLETWRRLVGDHPSTEWFHLCLSLLLDLTITGTISERHLISGARLFRTDSGDLQTQGAVVLIRTLEAADPVHDVPEFSYSRMREHLLELLERVASADIRKLQEQLQRREAFVNRQSAILMRLTRDLIRHEQPAVMRREVARALREHFDFPATVITRIVHRRLISYLPDQPEDEYDHLKLMASQNSWSIEENPRTIRTPHQCERVSQGEIISVPVLSENQLHGSIHVVATEEQITYDLVTLLETVGLLLGLSEEARDQQGVLQEFQKQMEHSEKLTVVGKLTAGLAHEVGNPLAAISSLVQLLIQRVKNEDTQEKLRLIRNQVERISRILRNLVDYSRIGEAAATSRGLISRVEVNPVLEEAAKLVRYDRQRSGVKFELQLDPRAGYVRAVPDRLMQVFMNILLNALDAIPREGGRIQCRTYRENGYAHVEILDNGSGISTEVQEHVFDPFFTTKPVGEGTGLGLWVTRGIIEELGGRIHLQSRPGHTLFHIELVEME